MAITRLQSIITKDSETNYQAILPAYQGVKPLRRDIVQYTSRTKTKRPQVLAMGVFNKHLLVGIRHVASVALASILFFFQNFKCARAASIGRCSPHNYQFTKINHIPERIKKKLQGRWGSEKLSTFYFFPLF